MSSIRKISKKFFAELDLNLIDILDFVKIGRHSNLMDFSSKSKTRKICARKISVGHLVIIQRMTEFFLGNHVPSLTGSHICRGLMMKLSDNFGGRKVRRVCGPLSCGLTIRIVQQLSLWVKDNKDSLKILKSLQKGGAYHIQRRAPQKWDQILILKETADVGQPKQKKTLFLGFFEKIFFLWEPEEQVTLNIFDRIVLDSRYICFSVGISNIFFIICLLEKDAKCFIQY